MGRHQHNLLFLKFSPERHFHMLKPERLPPAVFLAFSISCFVSAMGSGGAALAFFAFGVRCLFTLPCTFLLSAWSVASAIQLLQKKTKGTGRDRRIYDSAYFFRFFMCVLVLLVGLAAEITLVPRLVQLVLPDMM